MPCLLNFDKIGKVICKINDNPRYNKKKLCLSGSKDKIDSDVKLFSEMKLENGSFQLIPDKNADRMTMYVTGSAGSGKSYFIAEYVKEYHAMFKNNLIFLVSESDEDPAFDCLEYVRRLQVDESLLTDPIDWTDFKDCLVIFDDIDSMNGKLGKEVFRLRDKLLKNSRKFKVSVISSAHNSTGGDLKSVLNESQIIVFFLSNYSRALKYLLENYIGMSKKGVDKLRKMTDSRWSAVVKSFPNLIVQDKFISTLNSFDC